MRKLFIFLFLLLAGHFSWAEELNYQIEICDLCTVKSDFEQVALDKIDARYYTKVVVVNINQSISYAFNMLVEYEPVRVFKKAFSSSIPSEIVESVHLYNEVKAAIKNDGSMMYSKIPQHLSIASYPNGGANISSDFSCEISGVSNPVPPYIANSVKDLDGDIDNKQRLVREMLRNTYLSNIFGLTNTAVKAAISQFFLKRPLLVTTSFNDGSSIQWQTGDLLGTLPFIMLPDTAMDSNCKLIEMSNNNHLSFGGGEYFVNHNSASSGGLVYRCRLGFTNSGIGTKFVSSLICFWVES
ncbi:hypothetical protein [Rheinheimera sp. EpRS3]|uniref:hypothetical protein n=1 Tax=Rheinheimera sp. EpRS3 TaxID=1712383 RepID=UPI00074A5A99|nr:hypothetical protein [Rheinheimera sp. EpRS3]KUM54499.1 hypothetical protein AR688_14400 [Rheinheimera sp. EpRS3]